VRANCCPSLSCSACFICLFYTGGAFSLALVSAHWNKLARNLQARERVPRRAQRVRFPSEGEVVPQISLSYFFVLQDVRRGARRNDITFANDVGPLTDIQCIPHIVICD